MDGSYARHHRPTHPITQKTLETINKHSNLHYYHWHDVTTELALRGIVSLFDLFFSFLACAESNRFGSGWVFLVIADAVATHLHTPFDAAIYNTTCSFVLT